MKKNSSLRLTVNSGIGWVVAFVACHLQRDVLRRLKRLGLVVYAPVLWERVVERGRALWRKRALFPGYLFIRNTVGFPFGAVLAEDGVREILRSDGLFAAVPHRVVRAVRWLERTLVQRAREAVTAGLASLGHQGSKRRLKRAQRVRVVNGPFIGAVGVVQEMDKLQRFCTMLLDVMGRSTKVVVAADCLTVA